jgi:hypothetical protein
MCTLIPLINKSGDKQLSKDRVADKICGVIDYKNRLKFTDEK